MKAHVGTATKWCRYASVVIIKNALTKSVCMPSMVNSRIVRVSFLLIGLMCGIGIVACPFIRLFSPILYDNYIHSDIYRMMRGFCGSATIAASYFYLREEYNYWQYTKSLVKK